jgi:hypothetical protein
MWWDFVCGDFWSQSGMTKNPDPAKLTPRARALLDAMFVTLKEILELPDARTQGYALHGLGHLHHPQVRALVQAFIHAHNSELTPEGLRWVESCRDGTVM